jgi:hypothetical protein
MSITYYFCFWPIILSIFVPYVSVFSLFCLSLCSLNFSIFVYFYVSPIFLCFAFLFSYFASFISIVKSVYHPFFVSFVYFYDSSDRFNFRFVPSVFKLQKEDYRHHHPPPHRQKDWPFTSSRPTMSDTLKTSDDHDIQKFSGINMNTVSENLSESS